LILSFSESVRKGSFRAISVKNHINRRINGPLSYR
jgi:hypothetical protein